MPDIIVNPERCTRCNLCASICMMGIIQPASDQALPLIPSDKQDSCMRCGHCEAFCPSQALVLDYLTGEKLVYTEEDSLIAPHKLALYMRKRRSVRHFKPEPVSRDIITQILEITRYAPTGGNSQTVQWLVIYAREEVQQVAALTIDWMRSIQGSDHPLAAYVPGIIQGWELGYDPICCHAPHLVFAHIPYEEFVDDRTDAVIALSHFDIAAPAFGVGTCWAGFIRMACDSWQPLRDYLALPDRRRIGYGLFFGYPELKVSAIPRRNKLEVSWRG
ncbi:MAG TPA: nitroreductase family protein [Candidatus Cloacimonadota bacterium]|nr:nitroreductase family protein [Candidatus Cloacimonadota bacterium]